VTVGHGGHDAGSRRPASIGTRRGGYAASCGGGAPVVRGASRRAS
jgi:hypothetical protein